jgi:hypothetical protein
MAQSPPITVMAGFGRINGATVIGFSVAGRIATFVKV